MYYSIEPRDRIFVKDCRFLPFAENMGKNIGKNISRNLSSKYSQKLLDHAKQSATDAHEKSNSENSRNKIKLLMKLQKPQKVTTEYFRGS